MSLAIAIEEIADADSLLRRIHPRQLVQDGTGNWRPSSAAFKDPNMSGDVESMLQRAGLDPAWSIQYHPGHSLAKVSVARLRGLNQEVMHRPLEVDRARENTPNSFHAEAVGKKNHTIADAIRKASAVVILNPAPPTG